MPGTSWKRRPADYPLLNGTAKESDGLHRQSSGDGEISVENIQFEQTIAAEESRKDMVKRAARKGPG